MPEQHFQYLMNIDSVSDLVNRFDIKFESVERFLEIEATKKRKGKNETISKELRSTVTRFRSIGKEATIFHRFLTVIIGCMNVMKVPLEEVFVLFDVSFYFVSIIFFIVLSWCECDCRCHTVQLNSVYKLLLIFTGNCKL